MTKTQNLDITILAQSSKYYATGERSGKLMQGLAYVPSNILNKIVEKY